MHSDEEPRGEEDAEHFGKWAEPLELLVRPHFQLDGDGQLARRSSMNPWT